MDLIKGSKLCDCGHLESDHSQHTRGYGTNSETGKPACYACCLKEDKKQLKEHKHIDAYLSADGKHITNWPGGIIATVDFTTVRDFGYCQGQTAVWATATDGTKIFGRGPGLGMYCRLRVIKN